ncbi:MAG: DUF4392 domain-containing protein [Firmicutes bacterium]|nr:DUF4392 domain-containing protein [Bacillota bacterium]
MKIACESIDRLVTTEVRLPYLDRGIIPALYEAARDGGDPIVYQIANAIIDCIKSTPGRFGLITGFWDPQWMPDGENDGPIGAVVLGKALTLLGAQVLHCVEKEVVPVMKKMCERLDTTAEFRILSRDSAEQNAYLVDDLDAAIFIEKCGPSKEGIHHLATGPAREGRDAPLEMFLEQMTAAGKLSIGTGDVGNEIGFGKIYEQAREIVPAGKVCKCPAQDGIITALATNYLLPACTSNIGAYGMVAGLEIVSGNLELLHTPEEEIDLIDICADMNCIDGGFGIATDYVDGIPAKAVAAQVELLRAIVRSFFTTEKRPF